MSIKRGWLLNPSYVVRTATGGACGIRNTHGARCTCTARVYVHIFKEDGSREFMPACGLHFIELVRNYREEETQKWKS